jgi:glutamine synthetase adenylyltransferase
MSEPKLAAARVDAERAERAVRELVEAFNFLKTRRAPNAFFSPRKERRRSPQSQEGRAKPFELVGDALSTTSADRQPEPRTLLDALIEARSGQHKILEEFRRDHEAIERLRVTPQELQALSSTSLLGSLTCRRDVLLVLRQIREATKPRELQAAAPPERLHVPAENIEPSIPDISEMAERIRREGLARLAESDSLRAADRRSTLWQFGVLSSALILIAAATWGCIQMMLNWRHHPSLKLTLSVLSSMGARFGKTGDSNILVSGEILFLASVVAGIYLRLSRYRRKAAVHSDRQSRDRSRP